MKNAGPGHKGQVPILVWSGVRNLVGVIKLLGVLTNEMNINNSTYLLGSLWALNEVHI